MKEKQDEFVKEENGGDIRNINAYTHNCILK